MPGSYFEVIGQLNPGPQLHIIHLREIEPPIQLVKPNCHLTFPQPVINQLDIRAIHLFCNCLDGFQCVFVILRLSIVLFQMENIRM